MQTPRWQAAFLRLHLYQALAQRVDSWRTAHYPNADYPVIGENLVWAAAPKAADSVSMTEDSVRWVFH